MGSSDNRRFPRLPHVGSKQIVHVDAGQNAQNNFILTENLSASGIKFTTNSVLKDAQFFLIYLNDQLMRDLSGLYEHKKTWVSAGEYYLAKVVWAKEIDTGIFEIGASFVEKSGCREEELATLTELMNITALEKLPGRLHAN